MSGGEGEGSDLETGCSVALLRKEDDVVAFAAALVGVQIGVAGGE